MIVTAGDPAGVGPEAVVALLADDELVSRFDVVLVGDGRHLRHLAGSNAQRAEWVDVPAPGVERGRISAASGRAAVAALETAVERVRSAPGQALVTGPISKAGFALAGYPWPGQTEALAALTGAGRLHVLLVGDRLRVLHVSGHCSLRDAIAAVTVESVREAIAAAADAMRDFGIDAPRVGVAGLNPHAGESGLLGAEDGDEIVPAIAAAKRDGIDVRGPLSADTIFGSEIASGFDVIVAMYHDQGHIPVKLEAGDRTVAMSVGLPFVRASADHGAAPEVADSGRVRTTSLVRAAWVAAECLLHSTAPR